MDNSNNQFSFKRGGKQLPGQSGQANIFAMAASTSQRQDRSYYRSLYNFNADVELAEYSLPVLSNQQPVKGPGASGIGGKSIQGKASSGVINATQLPPLAGGQFPEGIEEEPDQMMDMDQMEMDPDAYQQMEEMGEEPGDEDDETYDYAMLNRLIENEEDKDIDQAQKAREANYISKGTYIWQLLSQIETGEQAIAFFAKHGHNTPIKFVNCKRRPVPGDQFRPYDLVIIGDDEKALEGEYFTISAQGVVHVGRQDKSKGPNAPPPTEFLSLSDWMQQSTLFNVLTSMNFFKHYLIGKVFRLWKGNVRFKTYNRTRQSLSRNLIQTRPAFLPTFLDISKNLFEMQTKKTFIIPNNSRMMEMSEFVSEQKQKRDNEVKVHYSQKVDHIITKSLDSLVNNVSESRQLKEEEDLEHAKMGQAAKHKSMVLMKEENALKARVLKLAKRNFQSLGTFIRLVDYMVVETQVSINQESADLILYEMYKDSKKYGINTIVSYATDGMSFEPAKSEFVTQFDKILGEMQSVTEEVPRVISHQDFHHYIHGLISDSGPRFRSIVEKSESYQFSKAEITKKINSDFDELQKIVNGFLECRDVDKFDREFDFEVWSKDLKDLEAVETIKAMLEKLQKFEYSVQKSIKPQENRGMIQVLGRKLQTRLSGRVKDEQLQVRQYLTDLAEKQAKDISYSLTTIRNDMGKKPSTLPSYIDFVSRLQDCKEETEKLKDMKKKLEDVKSVLTKYRPKDEGYQSLPLQSRIESLSNDLDTTDLELRNAEEATLKEREEHVQDLEKRLFEEQEKVKLLIEDVTTNEKLMRAETNAKEALDTANKIKKKYDESVKKLNQYSGYQTILSLQKTEIPEIQSFEDTYNLRHQIWHIRQFFGEQEQRWYRDNFREQDAQAIVQIVQENESKLVKIGAKLDKKDEVLDAVKAEVKNVSKQKNLIAALGNKSMLEKHWHNVWQLVGGPPGTLLNFNLNQLIEAGIEDHFETVEQISGQAGGEATILDNIKEISELWEQTFFVVKNYRDTKDRFFITEIDDLIVQLEDHQMTVQTMMGSKHVVEIRDEVEVWEKRLGYISDVIDEWLVFQRTWMYLENIFNSDDIKKQLPAESKMFQNVDKFWKDHMQRTKKNSLVTEVCSSEVLLTKFQQNNAQLEEIQKCLESYLETKRAAFPRFYFLSNDELLEILSQTRNVQAVQPHLGKCFDNVVRVEFSKAKNSNEILGMISAEKEYVEWTEPVYAKDEVELWLTKIEAMMRKTLYDVAKKSREIYPEDGRFRDEWFFESCAQCTIVVDQTKWTEGVTNAIYDIQKGKNKAALEEFLDFSNEQLAAMIKIVGTDLNKLQRNCMGAMIVIDVHAKEVVNKMIQERVNNINDFDWTCQLRYYWEEDDPENADFYARQTNTRFRYGYEYLGNGPRLVITPLTDKCYMTLTGALHLSLGGAPAGPAGTGKTETTKDLAKALAIQCVVFNCSDGLDFKMMARFFSGLAQGGAWACFDEFNRINIEVLSVIAQQILTIQSAVKAKKTEFEFGEATIPLNLRFGVFITMNPGYAGRTELPDNLKALFRPVAMMIPDYRLIAEIILYSEGFQTANALSHKMVKLYSLSSEQLSKQDHYDFGMRAVKSVLVMAGQLRRADAETPEDIVLIRAMKDSNVPKFLEHDLPLFEGIVTDLFPGVVVKPIDYGKLQIAIEFQLREALFQTPPKYVKKIIQLLETMQVRHGIMLVGVTGTGKTTCSKILQRALTQLNNEGSTDPWHKQVHIDTLNPKAVTMGELFGETNVFTNEWTEGLVSKLFKDAVQALEGDKPDMKRWLNFDGPVDALWIENMNTVLDDNKMLCLANGQRIKMPATMAMMFEVQDLRVASPATVSRCGMVYLEPVHLGWEPLIQSWQENMVEQIPEPYLGKIIDTIKTIATLMINLIRRDCKEMIPTVDSNLIQSMLNFLTIFFGENGFMDLKKASTYTNPDKAMMTYVSFSLIWSLGANVHDSTRGKFSENFKLQIRKKFPEFPDGDIYEFGIEKDLHKLEPWDNQKPEFQFDPEQSFFDILVPTSDTVKYKYLLHTLLDGGCNILISGETGVGKSVIVKDFLAKAPEHIVNAQVNFSGKTSTKNLQDAFEGNLEAKRKTLLGPPGGKKMVFFIDDINMPQPDTYGSQPPCELLRQAIDNTGFYDTKKLIFKQIKDTRFVSACAPPSGGRSAVTPRLFRHFNMVWVPDLSEASMKVIFTSILRGFLEQDEGKGLHLFAEPVIRAQVDIYLTTINDFLPTPSKCHYTFNLRDMSKVVQGILMIKDKSSKDYMKHLSDKASLVYLWIHETFRVFRDRLVDQSDRNKFNELAHSKLEQYLDMEWQLKDYENILYGNYENAARQYNKLSEINVLIPRLDTFLEMYNADNSPMNLVFFGDCIQHLSRVARVLSQQRGNCMLVGVGGSGRRSMARLGGSINEQQTFSIEITKSYREKEFHEDIRGLLRQTGIQTGPEDNQMVFLFSDTQIVKESFLEDINNLLNSGEIPNLFPPDEKIAICDEVAPKAREKGQGDTRDQQYAYFVATCRENLHIVLAFSPVGEQFRNRCRQFPSIINCCTIDWYNPWPSDALYSVAHRQYQADETKLGITEHIDNLCNMSVKIHNSVSEASDMFYEELRRKNYTTPTSYLDLVKTYKEMLGYQRGIVPVNIARYQGGLATLAKTNKIVEELKVTLVKLRPEIDQKEKDTQEMVVDLEAKTKVANEQEKITSAEQAESEKLFQEVSAIKSDCEAELAKAMPIYKSALSALDTLNKNDITEMKAYAKPAEEIVLVVSAVCLLMGKKENWDEGKKLMNNPNEFINSLKTYDKDNIKENLLKKLKKYTNDNRFDPASIASKSKAAESLCLWARALDNYSAVMKIIKPKQESLAKAEGELKIAQDELRGKQASLKQVKDLIHTLQTNYNKSQRTLEELNAQKQKIEVQLIRAEKLVVGLADEATRWTETVKVLEVDLVNLVGNIILAAGYISYVAPFTSKYRQNMLTEWQKYAKEIKIPYSDNFTVDGVLGDPVAIREWNIQGLPGDALSIENGIICTQAKRWPLLIDPQSQGNKWQKSMEKDNNLQVIKLSNPKFLQIVESGIRMGFPVLLENIEETLDPSLEPVLQKNIVKQQGQWSIRLGDSWIPYNFDFKFIITTKMANPHYLPEICIKVTVINFTVTPDGLEDQLLVDVVKFEQPELEQQKDQLVVQLSEFKRQLADTEAKILKLVSNAGDDILEDEELINTLDQSKETSIAINERMIEAEKTSKMINENRENYRGVARRGSVLYFVISDLALIDPMYQYSLEYFSKLFNKRLEKSAKSDDLEERLRILLEDQTSSFYINICRGLFEKDKLLYSFLNATSIFKRSGEISQDEWNIYLRGSTTDFSSFTNDVPYISDAIFYKLMGLEEAHTNFADISKSWASAEDAAFWRPMMSSEAPHTLPLPPVYQDRLNPFQQLMLIKVIREEKLTQAIKKYIAAKIGKKFIESPPFDLEGSFIDSSNGTPIIFVLSPGADPIANLMELAKQKNMQARLKPLSLGQGQGKIASRLIDQGQKAGDWVCLQNCHLSASWMPELEKIQEAQDENTMHPEYRLWLTSMPSKDFPVPVLQSGIKITNEPPRGLKANLRRTYGDIKEEEYESCLKPKEYKKLLFALGYFHAAILERRKYGPIGWNIPYEWMTSDFETSKTQVMMYLNEQEVVPYQALNYVVAEANYGGRVTDDKDGRLIKAMLKSYFRPEVMNDNFKLSKLDTYYCPPEGTLAETKAYIDTLPLDEDPEVFGMHPNANIAYEKFTVGMLNDTVLLMQPRVSSKGAGKSPDELVQDMCRDILSRLPPKMNKEKAHATTFAVSDTGQPLSLGVFVGQEIDRFNKLYSVLKTTLDLLDRAIAGTVVMSQELEDMMIRFQNDKVPANWEKVGYPSLKPLSSWVVDLIKRLEFVSKWLYEGMPDSFWLSAFFFPQGFMTASLQTYARKTATPIDKLKFRTHVRNYGPDNIEEVPEDGINMHGLFIEGARWEYSKCCLEDSVPREPIDTFPLIWLEPVMVEENVEQGCYSCPLYKTSTRRGELSTTGHSTNFVLYLQVPTEVQPEYWIRRGTALISMTND